MNNIEKFKFNPPLGFQSEAAFPNPLDEEQTREQLQRLHNQTRDYINQLGAQLNGQSGASSIGTTDGKSVQEVLKTISKEPGPIGPVGPAGPKGDSGLSTYEIWIQEGNVGTEKDFLFSLKGEDGQAGKDGYTPIKGVDYFEGSVHNAKSYLIKAKPLCEKATKQMKVDPFYFIDDLNNVLNVK